MTESSGQTTPRLSIIVPLYNEERYIEQTLESIASQTALQQDFEVLMYDGGSTDQTVALVKAWAERLPNLSLSDNPGRLPSAARNLGLRAARGEAVAFVEGHCVLPDHFVTRSMELLEEKQAAGLGRPIDLVVPSDPPIQQAIGIARQSPIGHAPSSFLYSKQEGYLSPISCATLYRRSVFERLGEFDESLYVAEDVEFNKRFEKAGFRHYFSQELKCLYHPRRTYREFFQQMYNYGLGRTRFAISQGRVSPTDAAPILVAGGVIASLLGMTASVWCGLLAAVYLGLIGTYSAWLALAERRPWLWLFVWIAVMIIHFGMAAGQVGGLLERLKWRG